jgi:hypothetical protein
MKRRLHADGTRACSSRMKIGECCEECKAWRHEYSKKYRNRKILKLFIFSHSLQWWKNLWKKGVERKRTRRTK